MKQLELFATKAEHEAISALAAMMVGAKWRKARDYKDIIKSAKRAINKEMHYEIS